MLAFGKELLFRLRMITHDWLVIHFAMDHRFAVHTENLDASHRLLLSMAPSKCNALPRSAPPAGVYLFSEGNKHLYVGRSNKLRRRIRWHGCGAHNQATFAFRLAREETGRLKATYMPVGSRAHLMTDESFVAAFVRAKQRIAAMDVRFVGEDDPLRQALLEIYVAVVLETPYNDFDNH